MSVYTRSGDDGETDLLGDGRVPKDAARLEVCGPLDELNCWLGLVRCEPVPAEVARCSSRSSAGCFTSRAGISNGGDEPSEALRASLRTTCVTARNRPWTTTTRS